MSALTRQSRAFRGTDMDAEGQYICNACGTEFNQRGTVRVTDRMGVVGDFEPDDQPQCPECGDTGEGVVLVDAECL